MSIEIPEDIQITKLPVKASNKIGRPRKYATPRDLQKGIDDYFNWLEEHNETMRTIKRPEIPPTTQRLAQSLGFSHRKALTEYSQISVAFSHVVDGARLRIEAFHSERASSNPAYSFHWLKKNAPDEWGNPEGESGSDVNVLGGGPVTINIQKNYGKMEDE